MAMEKSCGAVVFTRENGRIEYVIIQNLKGYYGFPKGHVEPGETEKETALREIFEETGLRPVILDGFRTEEAHPIPRKPDIIKHIVYFIAEYSGQTPVFQKEELLSAQLMTYEEAMSAFQFENSRRILREANDHLTARMG